MITYTTNDLAKRLSREDEVDILELLNIHTQDIIDRFEDFIEERYDYLVKYYGEDEEDFDVSGEGEYQSPWEEETPDFNYED